MRAADLSGRKHQEKRGRFQVRGRCWEDELTPSCFSNDSPHTWPGPYPRSWMQGEAARIVQVSSLLTRMLEWVVKDPPTAEEKIQIRDVLRNKEAVEPEEPIINWQLG